MKYRLEKIDVLDKRCDLLVFFLCKDDEFSPNLKKVDEKLKGYLSKTVEAKKFDGSLGKSITLDTYGHISADKIMVVGVGDKGLYDPANIFRAGCVIGRKINGSIKDIVIDFRLGDEKGLSSLVEGIDFGAYKFDKYKSEKKDNSEEGLVTIIVGDFELSQKENNIRRANIVSRSVSMTRDLVNEPPIYLTPAKMAEIAEEIASKGELDVKIIDKDEMERLGMGALLAVARGSEREPKFIHLRYTPKEPSEKTIALVGKGVTFDSGGLCLKPSEYMKTMKTDMAGAATVFGVMEAISEIKPKVNVHGIVPATENMTGGDAFKPDDIVYAMNGKSIEIINTDAEGRLILADALSYCSTISPDEIIDFATLTGACVVALGNYTAGIMGNNQLLIDTLISISEEKGEKMWQLPMEEEIAKEVESSIADIKNAGGRAGGAIFAAHFLRHFVPQGVKWVHIDIAGPAYIAKETDWYPQGATGFGVRTILEYLTRVE